MLMFQKRIQHESKLGVFDLAISIERNDRTYDLRIDSSKMPYLVKQVVKVLTDDWRVFEVKFKKDKARSFLKDMATKILEGLEQEERENDVKSVTDNSNAS